MAKYRVQYATVSSQSKTVPFSGLTMREIYSRFVITGQRPVENTNTLQTFEDDPYDPSEDLISRAMRANVPVENVPVQEETSSPEFESTE